MSGDLFESAAQQRLASRAPLAARLRPRTLDEVVGQRHLVAPGAPLRVLVEADRLGSIILWGPPGTGKTTLARLLADATAKAFVPLSAVASGVKDVREALEGARRRLGEQGQGTILFVDEVHRFNKAQQDVLLPGVEEGLVVLVGATTENPFFEVNAPLMSRATLWRLEALGASDLAALVRRGLEVEEAEADGEAVDALVAAADGDARSALTTLEVAVALADARTRPDGGRPAVTVTDVVKARNGRLYHQGVDEHYDQISAFIKSIRGSDPDAGLYWMARMLEAGEDARFLARRLVILASEDVGMADSQALVVAEAAARAVELVGLPEAALNLAHAVTYLATAPKSNRVTVALGRAREDVRTGRRGDVPAHLRDAHYRSAGTIGHGQGYVYPHDLPAGWVDQQYRPDEVEGHVYYEPSSHGDEPEVGSRLRSPGGGKEPDRS
ncbi:MAG TPA: replication-associated recombination protein A [Acidimicrobiales bacterium]|nr:replication-associated recombination protein A [Acidimicrobiales bacterium]